MATEPRTLGGRYELGSVLGYGGMAEVYAGRDLRLGREVAVKVLRADLARDPAFLSRFRREAQSAAGLNHPNIVAVYDTGEDATADGEQVPYIVMEYVAGRTLRDVLSEDGRLLPRRALEIVAEVASALEYSHRAGIVHRDIKPGNVMLTPTGEIKVMDFGIARAASVHAETITHTAQVLGTAQYLSPEQARGEHVDARSDIYSAGCLLYELVTGVPPFQGENAVAVAYQHVREDPVPPSQLDPDLPTGLDAVVLKAMSKNPANRYQDAAAFRADLERAAAGRRVEAPAVLPADTTAALPPASATTVLLRQDDDDRRGRRTVAYVLLAAAVVAIMVIGALLAKGVFSSSNDTVKVPNLVGKTQAQAETILQQAGLRLGSVGTSPIGKDNNARPTGQIYRQSPPDSVSANKNSAVDVWISTGIQNVTVPTNLVGMSLDDAKNALTAAGLTVGTVTTQDSSKPANTVLATQPGPSSTVQAGSPVNLTIASGEGTVPSSLAGLDAGTAADQLKAAGFNSATQQQPSATVPAGQVISYSPTGSQPLGTTVTLLVSSGPPPTSSSAPPTDSTSTSPPASSSSSPPPSP